MLAYYRVTALSEMTESSYRRALELLNRKTSRGTADSRAEQFI